MRSTLATLLVLCAVTLSLGCATTKRREIKTVDDLYAQAVDDLKNGLYTEALDGFEQIKARFAYSKYAPLADLRIADTYYERDSYIEAIDGYRNFLKYHPTHAEAPYAMYRVGYCYKKQMPQDAWFLPPSAEKDQATTKLAISAYRDMLARYPSSEYAEKAKEELDACRRHLADHEMYVARFYFKREKWLASAGRAEGILSDYPGLGLDAEALWIAGSARFYTQDLPAARAHLNRLEEEFKGTGEAGRAATVLAQMNKPRLKEKNPDGKTPRGKDIGDPAMNPVGSGGRGGEGG
ncbi:MAG: outer membrane protein assembly factor BamD, partial [Clostridia bacterium]|nr:outer membrane protein assembly factor BamD [Deltaproteobacteria bacterium]